MSAATPAIRANGLGKTYRIGTDRNTSSTAVEALARWARNPTQRHWTTFDALNDVSFEVPHGVALGIVGRNGAGKSTLLKILSRVTAPSRGRIDLDGRVGSLLEVGTGFHPELTGRENVYLNGAILGMTRAEIRRQYDAIVAFSGVEKFLETPVKRYSSGMYVRLAFAVAAHLQTEILLIDEVLAVGDAEFQRKSLDKMRDAAKDGRTVLYVSHLLNTVRSLCTSAILLAEGRVVHAGSVDDTLEAYRQGFEAFAESQRDPANRPGSGSVRLRSVGGPSQHIRTGDDVVIDFVANSNHDSPGDYYVSAHLSDDTGVVVTQCDSRLVGQWFSPDAPREGRLTIRGLWLKPGRYTVDMFVCRAGTLDVWEGAWQFDVSAELPYPNLSTPDATRFGVVFSNFEYEDVQ